MRLLIQRTAMRFFKACSSWGLEFYRQTQEEGISCAVIIYPLEEGGLFPDVTVDWYTCQSQAERHARDWRGFGHRVEVVCAVPATEQEFLHSKVLTS